MSEKVPMPGFAPMNIALNCQCSHIELHIQYTRRHNSFIKSDCLQKLVCYVYSLTEYTAVNGIPLEVRYLYTFYQC